MTGKEVQRWADAAMYESEPLPEGRTADDGPTVEVITMTGDPLGAIAAATMLYEGKVVRDLAEVSDEQRRHYFQENLKTTLRTPFEFVTMHFLVEGVTRAVTHQQVRQRTATFVQESLRFAVVDGENLGSKVAHPPSLLAVKEDDPLRVVWDNAVKVVGEAYDALVKSGRVPAEDARGLLPHNTVTRDHYKTDLRNLQTELAKRLCTQAQFDWRLIATALVEAIRRYGRDRFYAVDNEFGVAQIQDASWQFDLIADLFRPPCYLEGACTFMAKMDRGCTIRTRVEANADVNRPSSEWDQEYDVVEGNPIVVGVGPKSVMVDEKERPIFIGAIHPAEWLADPTAARVAYQEGS